MTNELPDNWKNYNLKDVCFFQEGPGLRNWQYKNKGIKFINIRCIKDGYLDLSKAKYLSIDEVESKYKRFLLNEGDYVLSSSGTIGRIAVVRKNDLPLVLNTSVIRFRTLDESKLDMKFLFYFLQSKQFFEKIYEQSQGSAIVNFGPTHLNLLNADLPSLLEQKKIAEILWVIDRSIKLTKKKIRKLNFLNRSLLQEEFSKSDKEEFTLENLCQVTDGAHKTPTYTESGVPFLRVTDIQNDQVDIDSCKRISREEHSDLCKRCYPEKGDILLSKNGTIGIPKLIDWDWEFSIFVSLALVKIKDKNVLTSEYLEVLFHSPQLIYQMFATSKQGTVTNLHLEEIRKFKIPLPSISNQKRVVEIFSCLKRYKSTLEINLRQLNFLKSSLSTNLLSGQKRLNI